MAATREELLSVVESAPLPPTTHGDSQQPQNDMSLACISRMLMEDDTVDTFPDQYPDHPKLLQTEQPFAQILYAANTTSAPGGALATALLPSRDNNNSTLFPGENSSTSKAFFKGMEDASMMLPRDNGVLDGRGYKKRFDMDDKTEVGRGRSRTDSEEEDTALKMLDRLIINGYDRYPGEMQEVLITLDKEKKTSQKSIRRLGRGGTRQTQTVVTDLDTLQNQRAGLRQLPLDRDIVLSLKDEVKNKYHPHFMVYEDHRLGCTRTAEIHGDTPGHGYSHVSQPPASSSNSGIPQPGSMAARARGGSSGTGTGMSPCRCNRDHRWVLQGWKGRVLCALTTWTVDDTSDSEVT